MLDKVVYFGNMNEVIAVGSDEALVNLSQNYLRLPNRSLFIPY